MAARGETIGRAYVKVIADGDDFSRSVERELAKAEPAIQAAGGRHSEAYAKEFNKRMSQSDIGKGLRDSLERGIAKADIADAYFKSRDWQRFRGVLRKRFGDEGEQAANVLAREFAHNLAGIDDAVEGIMPRIERMRHQIENSARSMNIGAYDIQINVDTDEGAIVEATHDVEELGDTAEKAGRRTEGFNTRFRRLTNDIRESRGKYESLTGKIEELSDAVGRGFGAGARNNFLNIFGKAIGGATNLLGILPRTSSAVSKFAHVIRTEMKDADGGIFTRLFAGARAFSTLLDGVMLRVLPGAAVGLVGLSTSIGTVTAALSLLAGGVTALASSITFGLVGAIAPIAGLFAPIIVGVSAVATALVGMDKASKKAFSDTIKPIKDDLKDLGDAARPGILSGIQDAAENLSGTFKELNPLFKIAGDAVGGFIRQFSKFGDSPAFDRFVKTMEETLPTTFNSLGTISARFGTGVTNVFTSLNRKGGPVQHLLEGINRELDKFAKVKPGQWNTFFDRAEGSARKLWDVLTGISDIFIDLVDQGQKVGDSLMGDIGDALHDIDRWMDSAEGKKALQNWFRDAQKFARALGNVVVAAWNVVDALDSPATRAFATNLTKALIPALNVLADAIGLVTDHLGTLGPALATAGAAYLLFGGRVKAAKANISEFVGNIKNAETRMGALKGAASAAAGVGGLALLGDGLTRTSGALSAFETTAGGALTGFAAGGPIGAAIGGAAGLFLSVKRAADHAAAAVKAAGDTASDSESDWSGLASTLDETTGAMTKQTRAFIYDKLQKDGVLDTLRKYGVSAETVTDALTGNTKASGELAGAELALRQEHTKNAQAIADLDEQIASSVSRVGWTKRTVAMREHRDELAKNNQSLDNTLEALDAERGKLAKDTKAVEERSKAVNGLTKALKGIPATKRTAILSNFPKTLKDVENYARNLKLTPKQTKTVVKAFGIEATDAQLKRLIKRLKEAGDQKPKPKVDADTKPIDNKLKQVNHAIDAADRRRPKPKIDADKGPFDNKAKDVNNAISRFNNATPTVRVHADTGGAEEDLNRTRNAVLSIPEQRTITIRTQHTTSRLGPERGASGRLVAAPTRMLIGEAGPEAVVPLNRPLSQVDPAVRELSAIAQGLTARSRFASGGVVGGPQRVVNVGGVTVLSPSSDPRAVAAETVNRLVAVGY